MQTDQLTQRPNSHRFVSVGPAPAQRRHLRRVDPGGMQTDQLTQPHNPYRFVSVGLVPAERRLLQLTTTAHRQPRTPRPLTPIKLALLAFLFGLFWVGHLAAQLQPESVFLVVNSRSWSSKTVANHFVHLRDIPPSNIFELDWPGSVVEVNISDFRKWILQPILDEIRNRNLQQQINCVVYSTDFPYAVSFASDIQPNRGILGQTPAGGFNVGSITGLTFHYRTVLAESTQYASVALNQYAHTTLSQSRVPEFNNQQYLMSMMLGYTSGRGNSVDEVLRSLYRSRFADGVFPSGTFYFMTNQDVRSTTRSNRFAAVIQSLKSAGRSAMTMEGVCPQNRRDILGLTMGFAGFDWLKSKSRVIPGAICENLTSYGAILDEQSSQTPISEFVRWGAAGTTGTVVEPYALAAKFPDPAVQLQYALGYTLVESIYGSVRAPYQLLAIGDPLCRAWSNQLPLQVSGLAPNENVDGEFEIHPRLPAAAKVAEPRFELFVDGRRIAACERDQVFRVNARKIPAGHHRAIITMRDRINPHVNARGTIPFVVDHGKQLFTAELVGKQDVAYGRTAMIAVQPEGIQRVLAFHGRTLVGQQVMGTAAKDRLLAVDTRDLGFGIAELQLVGLTAEGGSYFASPIQAKIIPDEPLRANNPPWVPRLLS